MDMPYPLLSDSHNISRKYPHLEESSIVPVPETAMFVMLVTSGCPCPVNDIYLFAKGIAIAQSLRRPLMLITECLPFGQAVQPGLLYRRTMALGSAWYGKPFKSGHL